MLIRTCTFLALSNHHLFLFMAMDFILFFFYFSMRVTLCNCLQNANKESNKTVTVWHKSSYSKYFKYIFTSRTHFTFYNIWENKFYWFFFIYSRCQKVSVEFAWPAIWSITAGLSKKTLFSVLRSHWTADFMIRHFICLYIWNVQNYLSRQPLLKKNQYSCWKYEYKSHKINWSISNRLNMPLKHLWFIERKWIQL